MTTTGVDGPRRATRDDFPGILDLVDRCFGHAAGGMAAEWCHVYDESNPDRHAVVCEDGRVVSHISIVEDELVVGDGTLPCWGITGVATDPRYRGRGHMSALLDFWTERLEAAEVPFGKLGGDRQRYGRWGWERAGWERQYRVTPRYLDTEPAPDVTVERYTGAEAPIDVLAELYGHKRYRVRRDREQWETRLERAQFDVLVSTEPGAEAYLVFSRTRRNRNGATVSEVAGDDRAIRALFAHIVDAYDRDRIEVNVHPRDPINAFLARPDVSGGWQERPNRTVRICWLPEVLEAYRGELEATYRSATVPPGNVILRITEDESGAEITWDGESVAVRATDAAPDIAVDRMAMARLLFWDASTVDGYDSHPLLESVLPLQFYVPLLDRV